MAIPRNKPEQKLELMSEQELLFDQEQSEQEKDATATSTSAADPPSPVPLVEIGPKDEIIQKLQSERDLLFDRLARQQAEFENFRKRSLKENADFREYAAAEFIKNLLPILDSFDQALRANGQPESERRFFDRRKEGLRPGVELIRKQLEDALAKFGVQVVEAAGRPFDPHVHEAIEMVESKEVKDNQVLEELQRGYKMKDRLLRPAMVRVARNHHK